MLTNRQAHFGTLNKNRNQESISGYYRISEIGFISLPKTIKKSPDKIYETMMSRQYIYCTAQDLEGKRNQQGVPTNYTTLLPEGCMQAEEQKEKSKGHLISLTELRRQRKKFREVKVDRICGAEGRGRRALEICRVLISPRLKASLILTNKA